MTQDCLRNWAAQLLKLALWVPQSDKMAELSHEELVALQNRNLPKSEFLEHVVEPWIQMCECLVLYKDEWMDWRGMTPDEYLNIN